VSSVSLTAGPLRTEGAYQVLWAVALKQKKFARSLISLFGSRVVSSE